MFSGGNVKIKPKSVTPPPIEIKPKEPQKGVGIEKLKEDINKGQVQNAILRTSTALSITFEGIPFTGNVVVFNSRDDAVYYLGEAEADKLPLYKPPDDNRPYLIYSVDSTDEKKAKVVNFYLDPHTYPPLKSKLEACSQQQFNQITGTNAGGKMAGTAICGPTTPSIPTMSSFVEGLAPNSGVALKIIQDAVANEQMDQYPCDLTSGNKQYPLVKAKTLEKKLPEALKGYEAEFLKKVGYVKVKIEVTKDSMTPNKNDPTVTYPICNITTDDGKTSCPMALPPEIKISGSGEYYMPKAALDDAS